MSVKIGDFVFVVSNFSAEGSIIRAGKVTAIVDEFYAKVGKYGPYILAHCIPDTPAARVRFMGMVETLKALKVKENHVLYDNLNFLRRGE